MITAIVIALVVLVAAPILYLAWALCRMATLSDEALERRRRWRP